MNVLAIGNSFSQDAIALLPGLAARSGVPLNVVNLYVGGCSLEMHCRHLRENTAAYEHETGGVPDGRRCTIDEALSEENWDIVVTQQASHDSGWLCSYRPFAATLVSHIHEACPRARVLLHQTWAYESGCANGYFQRYFSDQAYMYAQLAACYRTVSLELGLPLIPTGEIIQLLRTLPQYDVAQGGASLCRDGYHLSYTAGRYAAACAWLAAFTGKPLPEDPSRTEDLDVGKGILRKEEILLIHRAVNTVCFHIA